MSIFTLTVVTSRDGFIARATDDAPQAWASAEEQVLFFRDVEAADWAIMGRHTHEAADKPDRRRIIFSTQVAGWQRPTQLWIDPRDMTADELAGLVAQVHPLDKGLILGGTQVHDWFLSHGRIDRVHLTIELVDFGAGLTVFTGETETDPISVFTKRGFQVGSDDRLNTAGTRYVVLSRG